VTKKRKVLVVVAGAVVLAALVGINFGAKRGKGTDVEVAKVERRDVSKVVTASGEIQPKRRVNVSANTMGKVTRLAVVEGQRVQKGDFLLEIDAEPYESAVEQLTAAVRGAEAAVQLEEAALQKAEYDYDRAVQLNEKGFMSETEFKTAKSTLDIARARARSAREQLVQAQANLKRARHDLRQVHIVAEMSGVITALNVEAGESAIMGTINNPGTVLLTIADLSEMEAEVRVDETEVVLVRPGQAAKVRLDAHPDTTFQGVVTEVGNSAIRAQMGLGQESVDFKVVVAIRDSIPNIRPGLSASVDIAVAEEKHVLAVPIQCLTVRDPERLARERSRNERKKKDAGADSAAADTAAADAGNKPPDVEGVFVVEGGVAHFRPVRVGIAGQSHFVVLSGLAEGQQVVAGPFKTIGDLRDGERVKIKRDTERKRGS
jgi:HlyD family secretion protein